MPDRSVGLPRVSQDYLDARRRQILDAARRCFARNGFHRTSMQDIFAEAGLSSGAVYRYFRSKEELIDAIASRVGARVTDVFSEALTEEPAPPLYEVVGRVVEYLAGSADAENRNRIAVLAWAEAFRDPTAGRFVTELFETLRGRLVEVARRAQAAGHLDPEVDPSLVGLAAFTLLPGLILHTALFGGLTPQEYRAAVVMLLTGSTHSAASAPRRPS